MSDYYTREQLFETDDSGNHLLHRSIINAGAALLETMVDVTTRSVYINKLKEFDKVYASIFKELTEDEQKTYLNLKNLHGESALFIACDECILEIVKVLSNDNFVDPNLADKNNTTPLMAACYAESHALTNNARVELINCLLTRDDLDINLTNKYGETALALVFDNGSNRELQSLLLEHKTTNLILDGENGARSLFLACDINYSDGVNTIVNHYDTKGDPSTLKAICNIKYDYFLLDSVDDLKFTPLQIACVHQNFDIVQTLLSISGIDVNGIGEDSNTTLHFACNSAFRIENNTKQKDIGRMQDAFCIIEELLRQPNIEKQQANFAGLLPFNILTSVYTVQEILWQICELSCSYTFTWLMANVTEPELIVACDQRQIPERINVALTPLQLACIKGNVSIVSRLLTMPNIDVEAPLPRTGHTTLSLMFGRLLRQVEQNNVVDIINLLLGVSQTDVNRIDARQRTALMHAISSDVMLPNDISLTVIEGLAYRSLTSINHSCPLDVDGQQVPHTALDLCINRANRFKSDGDELRYKYYLQIMKTLFSLNAKRCQTEPEVPVDLIKAQIRIGGSSLSRIDTLPDILYASSIKPNHLLFCQPATSLTTEEKYQVLSFASQRENLPSSSSNEFSQSDRTNESGPLVSVSSGSVMYSAKRDTQNRQDTSPAKHARYN